MRIRCSLWSPTKLIAARDPDGFRPLCLGKIDDGYVVASETCAFDSIGAEYIRDLKPGEMIVIDKNGVNSITTHCGKKGTICVFEYVYFARPDSVIEGSSVHMARLRAGKYLWREHPVDADIVIGVPDSGLDAALGFSQESGIPYGIGFIKNRYIGRTFIQPSQTERTNSVKIKLNAISSTVKGKRDRYDRRQYRQRNDFGTYSQAAQRGRGDGSSRSYLLPCIHCTMLFRNGYRQQGKSYRLQDDQ